MNGNDHDHRTGEVIDAEFSERRLSRAPIASDAPPDVLNIIEKRAKLMERILEVAIKATHPGQWNDLGGKPWPTGSACEVMARRCGVSITNMTRRKRLSSDDKGDFYIYEVDATASLPSGFDSIEAFGTCSSRDQFLGTETGAGRELSEIDEGSIMKAAYTNMEVNAITRLLGVRNLSWERLAEMGIGRDGVAKVTYDSGAKGGGKKNGSAGSEIVMKFGKGKDKTIAEQTDENLAWYRKAMEEDLQNPEKAKYKANTEKNLAAILAEQAKRENAKKGTTAPAANGATASAWERIKQLFAAAGYKDGHAALTKQVTGKASSTELNEADVARVQQWVADPKNQPANDSDIPF